MLASPDDVDMSEAIALGYAMSMMTAKGWCAGMDSPRSFGETVNAWLRRPRLTSAEDGLRELCARKTAMTSRTASAARMITIVVFIGPPRFKSADQLNPDVSARRRNGICDERYGG